MTNSVSLPWSWARLLH